MFSSIALDSNGKAHIAYRDSSSEFHLKYATNAGGSWTNTTVDDNGFTGSHIDIAVDGYGKVHISYYTGTVGLKYANNTAGSWTITDVDIGSTTLGQFTSIALGNDGAAHISYYDSGDKDLKYAKVYGAFITKGIVDGTATNVGERSSIDVDRAGGVRISYSDQTSFDLRIAEKVGDSWWTTAVDVEGMVGMPNSLDIDDRGLLSVCYFDTTDNRVKLAIQKAEPSAPRNLELEANGDMVRASWSAPISDNGVPVMGYVLYHYYPSGSVDWSTGLTELTRTDGFLAEGVHRYKVAAYNALGTGPFCAEVEVLVDLTPQTAPSAPTGLMATPGNGNVSLIWYSPTSDGNSTLLGYKLYRGTSSGGEVLLTFVNSSMNYLDMAVTNGQPYFYKVSAFNSVGEGPLSSEVSATPMAVATVPGAPTDLYAFRGDSSMSLEWDAPVSNGGSAIIGYNIYRGNASGDLDLLISVGNVNIYADLGLVNGQTYYYAVSAVNAVGEGPLSNEASDTPASYPSAPRNLTAELVGDDVVLTWERPADDGGFSTLSYSVFRGNVSGSLTRLIDLGDVLTYTDEDIDLGVTYFYHVKVTNGLGESDASNEVSSNPDLPSSPALSFDVDGTTVTLTWTAPADEGSSAIVNYTIYRGTESGYLEVLATVGNVLTFVDDTVLAGHTYLYQVTAVNAQGEGPRSNEVSLTVGAVPSVPQNLEAVAGNGTVNLTWNAPNEDGGWPITGYKVYRRTSEGAEVLLAIIGNVTNYVDNAVTNGQTYYYRVSAVNAMGEGAQTGSVDATPFAEDVDDEDGDGGENTMLYIIIVIVAIASVAGVAAFFFLRKK
jgi:fibronectin type 3 domain-containing protein